MVEDDDFNASGGGRGKHILYETFEDSDDGLLGE